MTERTAAGEMEALAVHCEQAADERECFAIDCEIENVVFDNRQGMMRRFTQSLDAAMTLVPEGWSVALHAHCDDTSRASAYWGAHAYDFSYAATPALALCAAALRARTQSEKDRPNGD